MGGVPKTAMNLVGFPIKQMDIGILRRILQGGIDKMTEAGVVLMGGHSIEDPELKYGLSVTGFVHPDKILTKGNLKKGDHLILTKPLGTGIVNTAIKGGLASAEAIEKITRQMAALNRTAAEIMADFPVSACTDITGFGLLGHLAEMVTGTDLSVALDHRNIPVLPEAVEYGGIGMIPAGAYNNKAFRRQWIYFADTVDDLSADILFDPQTSGGLLICIAAEKAPQLTDALREKGLTDAAVIGEVVEKESHPIMVR